MNDTTCKLTDEQIVAALAVEATEAGPAALLSFWNERSVTTKDVLGRVMASPRLQRVAAFCAQAQGRAPVGGAEDRIRAMAGLRRPRERRARK
jgi:hypothetical protein